MISTDHQWTLAREAADYDDRSDYPTPERLAELEAEVRTEHTTPGG